MQVTRLRNTSTASTGAASGRPSMTVAHTTRVVQQATPMSGNASGANALGSAGTARPSSTLVANSCLGQTTSTGQKYVITQRTQPTVSQQSASSGQQIVQVVGTLKMKTIKPSLLSLINMCYTIFFMLVSYHKA